MAALEHRQPWSAGSVVVRPGVVVAVLMPIPPVTLQSHRVVEQRKEQTEDGNLQPGPGAVVEKQFEAQGQPDVVDPAADDRELVTSPSSSCRAAASQLELESSQGQSQAGAPSAGRAGTGPVPDLLLATTCAAIGKKPEPEVAGGAAQQLLDAHCLPAQGQQQQQVQGLTALEAGTPGSSAALPVVPDAPASPAPPATPAALVSSPLNTTPGSFGGQLLLSLAALAGHPGWQELHAQQLLDVHTALLAAAAHAAALLAGKHKLENT
ncbi:hypothetical protein HaLaN_12714 [Haematococcus lacustris]|uniref:Uncharacterized protein n=1 Tax=Haematococcus lacustris TaxID=44745 RepID=A0A699Z440_HAELA|nr:hypothetical protein HaLaN_12714 [Haematococcus lacustris]